MYGCGGEKLVRFLKLLLKLEEKARMWRMRTKMAHIEENGET